MYLDNALEREFHRNLKRHLLAIVQADGPLLLRDEDDDVANETLRLMEIYIPSLCDGDRSIVDDLRRQPKRLYGAVAKCIRLAMDKWGDYLLEERGDPALRARARDLS